MRPAPPGTMCDARGKAQLGMEDDIQAATQTGAGAAAQLWNKDDIQLKTHKTRPPQGKSNAANQGRPTAAK